MKKEVITIRKSIEPTRTNGKTDFVNKIKGSLSENANIVNHYALATLATPSTSPNEITQSLYDNLEILDDITATASSPSNTMIAQQLFSFNLIEYIKRKYGFKPSVEWLKTNLKTVTAIWYGKGSCPAGNKAVLNCFNNVSNSWINGISHTSGVISQIKWIISGSDIATNNVIDNNGYIHFLAYTDASDGVVSTIIETDFIELEVILNSLPVLLIKERMKDNGSVNEVRVRFYPGVEKSLHVNPYILHKAGRREELFTYPVGGEGFISGDNDTFVFPISIDFEYDDEIVVEFENVGNYSYTLAVDIIVNYYREEVFV